MDAFVRIPVVKDPKLCRGVGAKTLMCGLAGVLGEDIGSVELDLFQQLMTVSILRGRWGSGVTALSDQGKFHTLKSVAPGSSLVYGEKFYDMIGKKKIKAFSGHCRLPTRGAAGDIKNIHPHDHKHIIGVHNGTMTKVGGQHVPVKTSDSRLLIESIAEKGIEETIYESSGAYAIAYFDKQKKTLSFLRNYERPLYFGVPKFNNKVLYWASEEDFLKFVLGRKYGMQNIVTTSLPINQHVTYSLDPKGEIKPLEQTEVKQKTIYYSYTGHKSFSDTEAWWEKEEWNDNKVKKLSDHRRESSGVMTYETAHNFHLSPQHFFKILKEGCCWCTQEGRIQDYHKKELLWVSPYEFLCQECQKDDEIVVAAKFAGPIGGKRQ
jgi:asparagine synthetase B (glutamine-hydrolysing)